KVRPGEPFAGMRQGKDSPVPRKTPSLELPFFLPKNAARVPRADVVSGGNAPRTVARVKGVLNHPPRNPRRLISPAYMPHPRPTPSRNVQRRSRRPRAASRGRRIVLATSILSLCVAVTPFVSASQYLWQ